MRYTSNSLGDLLGIKPRARRKTMSHHKLEECFENPIIHRQIHGEKVYVPLQISRLWNQVDY
jgi:hypothetical protein